MTAAYNFYSDCIDSTGHRVSIRHRFGIITLLVAPALVQTNANRWRLSGL
jgi:hypothetical protein